MPQAKAHKVVVYTYVEGMKICGQGIFSRGNVAKGADVFLLDHYNQKVAQTKTDSSGEFSFTVNKKSDYTIRLNAGEGHGATSEIKRTEFNSSSVNTDNSNKAENSSMEVSTSEKSTAALKPSNSNAELKAIKRKLDNILTRLESLEAETRYRDILGGVGYILGIFGISFYLIKRK
jgi:nickel transport protein